MRLLHTSDWHVGRTFHGTDLLDDQARALEQLAGLVAAHGVDVVLVAGDVYDRAVPNAGSVEVCTRALEQIRAAGAVIVATPGNHDSATRLGAAASFAAAGGLHLRTRTAELDVPVLLSDTHGEVAVYGLPFLEPDTARHALGEPGARSHADVLGVAMDRVRADLAARPGVRSVVLAHAFVVGGEATGSERTISVGGVETVPAGVFDGVDYVALGHLHSPQVLSERVRYSGSPLPYSFGERSHRKAVWLVDLGPHGLEQVQRVDLPVVRGLSQLTGPLPGLLADPAHTAAEDHYVSAVLTDPVRPLDAMRRLQVRFPHAVHLEWQRPGSAGALRYAEKVRGRSDAQVVDSFLTDVRGAPQAWESELVTEGLRAAEHAADRR
ncbi:exonuclease SbcCD subunit D [Rhodococcus antarcticus]|jgi:exonuclease SbcD|uniref:Nuclease SbcCD subunit D n=1 Tax=Rhodococcus antarcticus TaxID=2987751 RepID=A0ABY6NXC0_9NOCA|nr:exonuclease SbcCD subunit D [Rhodococcus antarcticus]UZJ24032.1 exonuclease SbcCD subunit D [Rhodococcus antarcticus]